jgi:predicted Zn-dependent protease
MQAGSLPSTQAMDKLDTGLWLSNLHYLNWSDQPAGRITGMTRHACLWIENGRPVAPIENLRFDDTLFRMLGTELEALTVETEMHAETGTYRERQLGTCVNPGALLRRLKFTL